MLVIVFKSRVSIHIGSKPPRILSEGYYRADNNEHKCERDSWGLSFVGEFSLTRKRCWIALHVVRRSHYVHHVFFVKRCSQWGEYCVLPALWRLKQMSSKKEGISPRKMQDNFACGSQWFLCIQMDCTLGIPYPDSISLYRSISITMCFLWDYQVFRCTTHLSIGCLEVNLNSTCQMDHDWELYERILWFIFFAFASLLFKDLGFTIFLNNSLITFRDKHRRLSQQWIVFFRLSVQMWLLLYD